ncbi:MAG TPA: inositol monophosphatase family protein [Polyangiaceae bacterium]|jgi:histidinol-phosphatase|nr:inositol monophosphatase family protein [Polyangiaceae bacterium]
MSASTLASDLELAHQLAAVASEVALHSFQRGVTTRLKADGTQVTETDLEIERCLKELLARHRPDDAVLGEELGESGASKRRWLLDPIDGTSNFVSGSADWGTHVALLQDGHVVLGVITRPVLGRTWASRGSGAYRTEMNSSSGAVRLQVSRINELRESRVTFWSSEPHPIVARLQRSASWVKPDLNAILRVAEGELEAIIDPSGKPWDHAPAVVIVEEAGGRFSDCAGGQRLDLGEGRYTNGLIHAELERLLEA